MEKSCQSRRRPPLGIPDGQTRPPVNVLIDTNIFLDVLLEREGLADESQAILDWCESQPGDVWIAWHTLANLYYIGSKIVGKRQADEFVDEVLKAFEICPVDSLAARTARSLPMADFEDALQVAAAQKASVELIVTRNVRDYRKSPIPVMSPKAFFVSKRLG